MTYRGGGFIIRQGEVLLEQLDNLFDSLETIKWTDVYATITEQVKMLPAILDIFESAMQKMATAKDKAVKDIKDIGKSEWAYYIGYGLTFFIPATAVAKILGKAGKGGQMLGKLLIWIEKVLGKIIGYTLNKSAPLFEKLTGIIRAVVAKLRKGTPELAKIIRELFVKLREWLESFVGKTISATVVVIDNAYMTVQRISRMVNNKLTELYLIT